MFPLPPVFCHPDRSPSAILSHLLGHEGPHSPFAVLQNAGLLSSLSAGARVAAPDFTLFQVSVALTEAGEAQWRKVADVIFQHCRLVSGGSAVGVGGGEKSWRIGSPGFWIDMNGSRQLTTPYPHLIPFDIRFTKRRLRVTRTANCTDCGAKRPNSRLSFSIKPRRAPSTVWRPRSATALSCTAPSTACRPGACCRRRKIRCPCPSSPTLPVAWCRPIV